MSSNGVKLSMESYFKLNIDRVLSSDSSSTEKSYQNSKSEIFEFEKPENYFARRLEAKKLLSIEFVERAAYIYSTKFGELLHKQEAEKEAFKRDFVLNVKYELDNWQKWLSYVRQEEEKLINQLKHLKEIYSSSEVKNRKLRKISDMHKVFFEKYEELLMKHRTEVKSMKEVINEEIARIKRNFSQELCKKESNLRKNSFTAFCTDGI